VCVYGGTAGVRSAAKPLQNASLHPDGCTIACAQPAAACPAGPSSGMSMRHADLIGGDEVAVCVSSRCGWTHMVRYVKRRRSSLCEDAHLQRRGIVIAGTVWKRLAAGHVPGEGLTLLTVVTTQSMTSPMNGLNTTQSYLTWKVAKPLPSLRTMPWGSGLCTLVTDMMNPYCRLQVPSTWPAEQRLDAMRGQEHQQPSDLFFQVRLYSGCDAAAEVPWMQLKTVVELDNVKHPDQRRAAVQRAARGRSKPAMHLTSAVTASVEWCIAGVLRGSISCICSHDSAREK
jgi:hypothetical protein